MFKNKSSVTNDSIEQLLNESFTDKLTPTPLNVYILDAARYELTSKFTAALNAGNIISQYDFTGRAYGFDITVCDLAYRTRCVLLPTIQNNKLFNAGRILTNQLVQLTNYRLIRQEVIKTKQIETIILVESMTILNTTPNKTLAPSIIGWHPDTPHRISTFNIPCLTNGRTQYLPPCNTDSIHGLEEPYKSLPR